MWQGTTTVWQGKSGKESNWTHDTQSMLAWKTKFEFRKFI